MAGSRALLADCRSTIGVNPTTGKICKRPRSPRSLKAKFRSRIRQLLRDPRSEIPRHGESRRPNYAAEPEFFRAFLKYCVALSYDSPTAAIKANRIALRLTPYVPSICLIVHAWGVYSQLLRITGRVIHAEVVVNLGLKIGADCRACAAHLQRSLALIRREQGQYHQALMAIDEAISFYEAGYDPEHDLESDGLAAGLWTRADICYCAEDTSGACRYCGQALVVVSSVNSPELHKILVLNYPHYLAASGRTKDLIEADRYFDDVGKISRPAMLRAKLNWGRWKVKYLLRRATYKQTERELRKSRRVFIKEKMGPEVVIITADIAKLDVSREDIRRLILDFSDIIGGTLEIAGWVPNMLHEKIQRVYRLACSVSSSTGIEIMERLFDELREAAGGKEIMPL